MTKNKTEKFLFNQNIFDEPDAIEEEILEPPAPTFSEDELENVRRTTYERAYEQGKKEGIDQERGSREEMAAQVLKKLDQQAGLIFAAEHERDKLFEQESLNMTLAIFDKLFPAYASAHGVDELKTAIQTILQKQENQSEIIIEVHPDLLDEMEAYIALLGAQGGAARRFELKANPVMTPLQCALYWKDGGAVRNTDKLALEIRSFIHDTLAGSVTSVHDGDIDFALAEAQLSSPEHNSQDSDNALMEKPDEQ